ncbi:MAG: alpha/beta fold hydrolase [Eggerthellaceae bacterium]|nr:alpha/beta fold hydrolase [Eggerthellaceae bacterium]MDR2721375.1 alpha/beta fold hydrolase [Coriobacteriaceae bacterium]
MTSPDKFFTINKMKMHYVDQGQGTPIVMLHGNPTWSFFYRNLIRDLSKTHRVIAPDHIGMGFSDKPQDVVLDLAFHIENLTGLLEYLNLENIILVVHDWGGPIGFGYAVTHLEKISKIVVLNSAAFFDLNMPKRIALARGVFGKFLIQRLNLFARAATHMTTIKKLPKEAKQGYLLPYDSYQNRRGIYAFLRDVPLESDHRTRALLDSIEGKLHKIKSDILILWAKEDFCFTEHFLNRWKGFFPQAKTQVFENAGHYILEDAFEEVLEEIKEFVQ